MEPLEKRSKPGLVWRTSSACPTQGSCVEIAALPDGGAAMRDSKDPQSPELRFDAAAWSAFIGAVANEEFTPGTRL